MQQYNTEQNSSTIFPLILQTIIIAQMLSIGGEGVEREREKERKKRDREHRYRPVTIGWYEVEAAVDTVVLNVPTIESCLVLVELIELTVNVVLYRPPAVSQSCTQQSLTTRECLIIITGLFLA